MSADTILADHPRFWSKVDASGDCWEWIAATNELDYGQYVPGDNKKVKAHRFAYELLVGAIPKGLELDHLCRNHRCVNPDHLEPVTHRVNMLRGYGITRRAASATHCPKGHKYSTANTYISKQGYRSCRLCRAESSRKHYNYQGNVRHAPKTHCKHGHPFDEANTRINPHGHQVCRTCHRARNKAADQRKIGEIVRQRTSEAA